MTSEAPRLFTVREACDTLGLGLTQMRAWVATWEQVAGELPRAGGGSKPNAARLIPANTLERIKEARGIVNEHPGRISADDALRRVLGLEVARSEGLSDLPAAPLVDLRPALADALHDVLAPVVERLERMERALPASDLRDTVREVLRDELGQWEASQESAEAIQTAVEEAVSPLRAEVQALAEQNRRLLEALATRSTPRKSLLARLLGR